jgi:predicted methyltransferase
MLPREAVAAALALAGIRTGARVLDLAPGAGLTRAARAMTGPGGRVDTENRPGGYDYLLAVRPDLAADEVVDEAAAASGELLPSARVVVGSTDSLVALVDRLRGIGWTVLHGTTVPQAATSGAGARSPLALAAARPSARRNR